jgi:hypothetical protein
VNGNSYSATVPLLTAIAATGNTVLAFFRRYVSAAAMPYLVFDRRVRGITPRLSSTLEAAIASALLAAAAPAQASLATWSDGNGWNTTEPPFNPFPLPFEPIVAPSSMTLGGPTTTYFSFVQSAPSARWAITHNLGRIPTVAVFDVNDKPLLGEVTYLSLNEVVVAFPAPIAGLAYLA